MAVIGPKLPTRNVRYFVAMRGKADVTRAPLNGRSRPKLELRKQLYRVTRQRI
jgi:hypothetical protein